MSDSGPASSSPAPEERLRPQAHPSAPARRWLGIPDEPVIHLAITELAERLMAHAVGAPEVPNGNRQQALRAACGGVLFNEPFACVLWEFLYKIDQEGDRADLEAARAAGVGTDWLGAAARRLRAEGHEVPEQPAVLRSTILFQRPAQVGPKVGTSSRLR